MKRVLLLVMVAAGCEPEPELAVAAASLVDDASVYVPIPDGGLVDASAPPTEAELRQARLRKEITAENAMRKAKALEAELDDEIESLETRLRPVEVDMGGE